MTDLAIRDQSAIGAALDAVVQRRAQVRLKDSRPHLPGHARPEAVRQFEAELRQAGYRIVRAEA